MRSAGLSECSIAADFFRTLQLYCSQGDKALRKMCDCHLVFNWTKLIMSGLLDLALTEAREILFNHDTLFVRFFEESGVSRYPASSIVCYIKILCTAITGAICESVMMYRANFGCFDGVFPFCFNGTAEFDPVSIAVTPCAVEDHFQSCIAKR